MVNSSIAEFRPDQENVAYIGAGVVLKGEISVPDLVVIDGTIEGSITARVVSVGQSGVVRGTVSATEADVSGSVSDDVDVKQLLIIRNTGRIEGKIRYGEIELEKGAVVTGDLSATDDFRSTKAAPAKAAAPKAAPVTPIPEAVEEKSAVDRINRAVRSARGVVTPLPARRLGGR